MLAKPATQSLSRTVPPMTVPKHEHVAEPVPSDVANAETSDSSTVAELGETPITTSPNDLTVTRESKYQVILEEVTHDSGRKRWLSNDQRLRIGRTSEADFSFPTDLSMSHLHFALECAADACYLHDLGSSNGTQVNDESVQSTILRDGDRIRAGDTLFLVHIHGGVQPSQKEIAARRATDYVHQDALNATVMYHREILSNGLLCVRGEAADCDPTVVAKRLVSHWPLYFIVDPAKVSVAISPDVQANNRLLDWLPPDADGPSPVLLPAAMCPEPEALMHEAWGSDGLVGLFTELDGSSLLHLLRAAVRGEAVRPILKEQPDHVVGIHIPSVLRSMLRSGTNDQWSELFPNVEAVLIENEGGWELMMPVANEQRLPTVGLRSADPSEPQTAETQTADN